MAAIRIGIIGDFKANHHTHVGINTALEHLAAHDRIAIDSHWIPTPELATDGGDDLLSRFDALWATPASPYDSFDGMLRGIEYARTHNVPFTGT